VVHLLCRLQQQSFLMKRVRLVHGLFVQLPVFSTYLSLVYLPRPSWCAFNFSFRHNSAS